MAGVEISDQSQLVKMINDMAHIKKEYEKLEYALHDVETKGYGIVSPSMEELSLEEPEIVKQGQKYGVKLKAKAPSIHMIKVDVESTFEPIIGSEAQAEALINHMLEKSENNIEELWNSEIFGRKLCDVINDGIYAKINNISDDTLVKFKEALEKVVNQARGGLIAVII